MLYAAGQELYPRIGKWFDLKTWTNCRMGMMGWAIWPICFAIRQYQLHGQISPAMAASVIIQQVYVFKFFL